jgi:hypothetical protein
MDVKTIYSHEILSGHPSGSPAAGFLWQYALSDGFYEKNSSGMVTKITNVAAGSVSVTTAEVNISTIAKNSGSFQITGLSGLTPNKQVIISQAAGPYTGKGNMADETEMDSVAVNGYVLNSTTIICYWNSATKVAGNFKFNYFIQS